MIAKQLGSPLAMQRIQSYLYRKYVNIRLNKMEDEDKRISAVSHLYGVSLAATMIAKKRGLNPEIAAMAAMLHDMHAYDTGSYDDHAHKGADLAGEILGALQLTDEEETDMICQSLLRKKSRHDLTSYVRNLVCKMCKKRRHLHQIVV